MYELMIFVAGVVVGGLAVRLSINWAVREDYEQAIIKRHYASKGY